MTLSSLLNAVQLAFAQLWRGRARSALTSLGVLIGVASVIAMVGLGKGATASIEADLASFGVNLLMLSPGTGHGPQARSAAPPFDLADVDAIRARVPNVSGVAPMVSTRATVFAGGVDRDTGVTGTSAEYLQVAGRALAEGRMFNEGEERAGAAACVLGQTVRETLFGAAGGLGERLRVGKVDCRIVGVLAVLGEDTMGQDRDDLVLMPVRAVQRRLIGNTAISMIFVSARSPGQLDAVRADLDALMRERRHVTGDNTVNFEVRDTREIASMMGSITGTLTAFLAAVAGVSLLVGGIGIMNIMLVSVTERTQEIGIRMAIGALESDIRAQFLIEAAVLSGAGGLLGAAVGVGGTWAGATALGLPVVVSPPTVVLAVVFSALMGVIFGWVPARRAARLEPIDALRHT